MDNTPPYILYKTKEGNTAKTVAPIVKNSKGEYATVTAIIYTPAGLPIALLVCQATKEVPSAEWEPLQPI